MDAVHGVESGRQAVVVHSLSVGHGGNHDRVQDGKHPAIQEEAVGGVGEAVGELTKDLSTVVDAEGSSGWCR